MHVSWGFMVYAWFFGVYFTGTMGHGVITNVNIFWFWQYSFYECFAIVGGSRVVNFNNLLRVIHDGRCHRVFVFAGVQSRVPGHFANLEVGAYHKFIGCGSFEVE